ncbi:PLC-like phosphodiesterase [Globomyces pollinis-pini]|nr:PLC-like phosphodiesterase [Globomyces pollinis-pini]
MQTTPTFIYYPSPTVVIGVAAMLGYATYCFYSKRPRTFGSGPFPHMLMSHRGGSREYVENTMPAFRHSARLKVDLLELDVQYTKDGKVVIFHDLDLGRICGLPDKKINDFNYKDLPPIIIPEDLKSKSEVVNDEESTKIPLLETLFQEFPTYPMQIDVKYGPEPLVIEVGQMIKKLKRENVTLWGSFRPSVNNLCYKHFGTSIPLFFDVYRFSKLYIAYWIGCLWLIDFRETAVIMPNLKFLMCRKLFKAINRQGISIIVFGMKGSLNTDSEWEEIRKIGANGICTDYPTNLKSWLKAHPLDKYP